MYLVTLSFRIIIHADAQTTFDYVSDWEQQSTWIPFTNVLAVSTSSRKVGDIVLAHTKLGRLGFTDAMVVTEWQPPLRITMEHTGRIILGKGTFIVEPVSVDRCRFVWREITPVPFGLFGRAGLLAMRPLLRLVFGLSLRRLKQQVEKLNQAT